MTLATGTSLGPYEILSLIGAGGMGEVYKARDTRLDRSVAIKLLPPAFAERPDRRRRFETEARAISSLNHPNICTLFDVGSQDGHAFLVMEFLEGETLDDRLTRGALALPDLLEYATAIAGSLDHAHRQGIVHRDLKPSNVMITAAGVKLLDFGLAKGPILVPASPLTTATLDPTPLTNEGTLVGTFQYMAPEQLEAKPVDARTDIFAFGTLLYEMATGRKAFEGGSHASLIASILTQQPPAISSARAPIEATAPLVALDHIVERCLAKSPDERWQTARDLKLELEWVARETPGGHAWPGVAPRLRRREAVAWALTGIGALVIAALTLGPSTVTSRPVTRFIVTPPRGTTIGVPENRSRIAMSPDGRSLAFLAFTKGGSKIWVRRIDELSAQPLAGTDGAVSPFWSPDSRSIGFFSPGDSELRRVSVSGGPAMTICKAEIDGAPTWGRDGSILFTSAGIGILRVAADGGTPKAVTQRAPESGEMNHYWPEFLPDGKRFLFMATSRGKDGLRQTPGVYIASFDSPEVKLLARMHSRMVFVPPDRVLFVQDGALLTQLVDLERSQLLGEPVRVADGLGYFRTLGNGSFSVSETGVLAFLGNADPFELHWYDRLGNASPLGWGVQTFGSVRLSPDGLRVAAHVVEPKIGTSDIWIYDVERGAPVRLSTELTTESHPVWAGDGRSLLFRSDRGGSPSIYSKALASGDVERLVTDRSPLIPEDWSTDGQWIAYDNNTRQGGMDLWLKPRTGAPRAYSTTRFEEWGAKFSPDSRWVAFVSTESGAAEVYVAPVGAAGDRKRISVAGGFGPRWRRDGRELYYVLADASAIMAVDTHVGQTFSAGLPHPAIRFGQTEAALDRERDLVYDVSPDGQRFLVSVHAGEPSSSQITIVQNWMASLSR